MTKTRAISIWTEKGDLLSIILRYLEAVGGGAVRIRDDAPASNERWFEWDSGASAWRLANDNLGTTVAELYLEGGATRIREAV